MFAIVSSVKATIWSSPMCRRGVYTRVMNTCDGGVHIFAVISANNSPYCLTGLVRVPYLGR